MVGVMGPVLLDSHVHYGSDSVLMGHVWLGDNNQVVIRWGVQVDHSTNVSQLLARVWYCGLHVCLPIDIHALLRFILFCPQALLVSVLPFSLFCWVACLLFSSFFASVITSYHVFLVPTFAPGVWCPSSPC